ncbi:hypothetical protein [Leifsonia sp. 1010]|uniref:hypothetical protein n=1 Tax=Leifsonia sp. 1010 TaxID=2817769 RepID=UPI0028582AFC|nr:hypothetical protein [Leifsonia sp. 1010]MDR6612294.1 hypothetical protein [Leifsonia sp. 1010]
MTGRAASGREVRDDRGSVTAEFAVALPAVLACLALCVGALYGAVQYGALAGGAATAARLEGRGDDPGGSIPDGAAAVTEREGRTVCVRLTAEGDTVLSRLGIRLSVRACALDEAAVG